MIDDEKIIEMFFERSEQGIRELDIKYGAICHNLSYNIVNNRQDAEECVNDAYLGAWNAIPPVHPKPLLSYIVKIVRNISLKIYMTMIKTLAAANKSEQKKEAGKTVTVTMTVESKDETAAANASDIKNTASGKTLDFLEIKVEKKVDEGTAETITTTDKLLTIIIPFDFTGKTNISVYRYHGSAVNTLTTTADRNGEYITLGTDIITLYVKNFSTYAIGYTETAATYTVTVQNDGHGTASASPSTAAAGTEITLNASPNSHYRFKTWQVVFGAVTISNNKFTMPAGNVAVKAVFEYIGGGSSGSSTDDGYSTPSYPPVIEQPKHGTIKVSPSRPESGDKVTITVTPENGYETQAVTVTDRNGRSVKVTKNANDI